MAVNKEDHKIDLEIRKKVLEEYLQEIQEEIVRSEFKLQNVLDQINRKNKKLFELNDQIDFREKEIIKVRSSFENIKKNVKVVDAQYLKSKAILTKLEKSIVLLKSRQKESVLKQLVVHFETNEGLRREFKKQILLNENNDALLTSNSESKYYELEEIFSGFDFLDEPLKFKSIKDSILDYEHAYIVFKKGNKFSETVISLLKKEYELDDNEVIYLSIIFEKLSRFGISELKLFFKGIKTKQNEKLPT